MLAAPIVVGHQAELDQRLVNGTAIFQECNLQLLATQAAAERFQSAARLLEGRVCLVLTSFSGLNLTEEKVRLIRENREFEPGKLFDGLRALGAGRNQIARAQRDPHQKQPTKHALAGHPKGGEERESTASEAPRLV